MSQNPIFVPNDSRTACSVNFDEGERDLLEDGAVHVRGLLTGADEVGATARLFPPARSNDWARRVEYDRLKKEGLSESHVEAMDTLLKMLSANVATADQIEEFMRAVNFIRLVVSKPLNLTDDTTDTDFPFDHPMRDTWLVYLYFGDLQFQALQALRALNGDLDAENFFNGGGDPSNN